MKTFLKNKTFLIVAAIFMITGSISAQDVVKISGAWSKTFNIAQIGVDRDTDGEVSPDSVFLYDDANPYLNIDFQDFGNGRNTVELQFSRFESKTFDNVAILKSDDNGFKSYLIKDSVKDNIILIFNNGHFKGWALIVYNLSLLTLPPF